MKFSHLPRNNLNRISDISIMEGQANIFPPKLLCNLTMIGLAIYAQDRISTPMLESMIIASKKETSTMYTQFHSTENQFSVLPSESLITDKQPNTENTVQNPQKKKEDRATLHSTTTIAATKFQLTCRYISTISKGNATKNNPVPWTSSATS